MKTIDLNKLQNYKKKFFLILSDFVIVIFSVAASYSLRLEKIYSFTKIDLKVYILFLVVIYLVFYFNNIYQILLRYFDYFSIKKIIKSILFAFLILVPINFYLYKLIYFPRSISFIALVIICILILSQRVFVNFLIKLNSNQIKKQKRILIIGVDNFNIQLIKNIRQTFDNNVIQALIDTNNLYKKRELNGIKIFKKNDIHRIVKNFSINEIIIGKKSLSDKEVSELFDKYENKNISIKKIDKDQNNFSLLLDHSIATNLNFFEIIDRPKKIVKKEILEKKIKNKIILVTGGGGSIGSELCIEILKHEPKKLFILEISEINLFNLLNKIKENKLNVKKIKLLLADCNDEYFLENYFKTIKIDEVYHAAAYKHVNFGEENPYSIIKNNIYATKTIVHFSMKKRVNNFIFISSDKAVNPKSMLGYTKNYGEKIIKYEYLKNKKKKNTNFTIVRFGNVIGSSGSVIPIFLNQIKKKQPLTVTNKKARRYFMSISEAVQLVINASYLNKESIKTFALNMGEQLYIYKIAERIIRLSGHTVKNNFNKKGDIPIKIIGLKKGEKISEEISLGNNLLKTSHSEIMLCDEEINFKSLENDLKKIKNLSFPKISKIKFN